MEKDWKDLFESNYQCKGICAGLDKEVKKKSNISYIGWALAERLFEQQDGVLEVMKNDKGGRVFTEEFMNESGIFYAYFVEVKAKWMGREYTEYYPMQDYMNKPLKVFTQNDVNKNIQRAKAKAIAIVSGIGYALYEKGDLQFEDDVKEVPKKEVKQEVKEVPEKDIRFWKSKVFTKMQELGWNQEMIVVYANKHNLKDYSVEEFKQLYGEL